jgi:hypothetical protein
MAEKDISEKALEGYNDVFADIVNVLLFGGKRLVSEDDLEAATAFSYYKADKPREQERDVAKYWKKQQIRIALYGFENQTEPQDGFPIRIIGYDGAAYREEMALNDAARRKGEKPMPYYPVVTLVLYFGEKHWDKPTRLLECFDVPEELKPFVNDYKINLFEIAHLTEEQASMFTSDFRIVADYFIQMRKNKDYVPKREVITHVKELLQLMSVMTGDHRFEEAYDNDFERRETTMCEVLDRVENRGRSEGRNEERKDTLDFINQRQKAGDSAEDILQAILSHKGEDFQPDSK